MRVAKALARLHKCLGSHEPSLLANAIRNRISLLAHLCLLLEYHTLCMISVLVNLSSSWCHKNKVYDLTHIYSENSSAATSFGVNFLPPCVVC